MKRVGVVIPNWNGLRDLPACLDSLTAQTLLPEIIVVDNGSTDGSVAWLEEHYPHVILIRHARNKGYAGGINPGFQWAIDHHWDYVATFNNDAIADKHWLEHLVNHLDTHSTVGIAAAKLLDSTGTHLDSTGEAYSSWGLPFPRGRGESNVAAYDDSPDVLGASGGSSLYRVAMLRRIGLFDKDFFAYYEDVDISLRAQLAGWKVAYVPTAEVRHQIGATGSKLKDFYAYQTIKNYPWLVIKDLPPRVFWRVLPRFLLAHGLIVAHAVWRGQGWAALKAIVVFYWFLPKKLAERSHIQSTRAVTSSYIWSIMTHDLPPHARGLRRLRDRWWQLCKLINA